HTNLGEALYAKGRLDEAIAAFRQAIRLKKDFPEAHANLGEALAAKGQLDEAIAACREAIRLRGDDPDAHWNLGVALQAKGQCRRAVEAFRRAHRLASRNPEWRARLGFTRHRLRQAEQLARLADRLPAVLAGKDRPKGPAERLGFARLCQTQAHR